MKWMEIDQDYLRK